MSISIGKAKRNVIVNIRQILPKRKTKSGYAAIYSQNMKRKTK